MKRIFLGFIILFSSLSFATPDFPLKNIKVLTDWDYMDEVQNSKQWVAMIFTSSACLERVSRDNSCFLFERRMDYVAPKFSKNVKVMVVNTYFDNYRLTSQFNIQKTPTVIIMKNNQIIKRLEPDFSLSYPNRRVMTPGQLGWGEVLFQQTTDILFQL